ncbi:1-acyl-sn-glycerol-3-phosphate acyltransferase [Henriciella sp.]|uniref:lysophospholipid acyltransferase family protein n=1 Tax=Henriciella sp. TaxID=1968823 RepID=UPI002624D6AF|nr:1-acyl-sn-glycerol-3-phosphate acyltransferase [Henriciella sp.]
MLFTGVYYALSFVYVILTLPTLVLPGRGATAFMIKSYTRSIRGALRLFAGIRCEIRGHQNLPDGPYILAAKHQSWGDGFLIYPEIDNLAFVTGDHLERFPFVGGILKKLGAIVIDTCGGGERKAQSLTEGMSRAKSQGRRVLIYPEGHLAPPGYHFRYKPGVWHMQKAMDVPVIPVATNLGCYWQQQELAKKPGTAVIEFLPAIEPGKPKKAFMEQLANCIEEQTAILSRETGTTANNPTVLLPDPVKGATAIPEPLQSN